jgi:predicted O-methyltransferase YrrM
VNIDCFLKRFTRVLLSSDGDAQFEAFKMWLGGTTSAKIAKLLNFAVSQMDQGECYVEVGVFTGTTLVSAFWANGKPCVGIDSYGANLAEATVLPADHIRERARTNVSQLAHGVKLIEKDFRDVKTDELPGKVAVCFIDALHTFDEVRENLAWLELKLADDALVFFDDINHTGVSQAIFEWLDAHPQSAELTCYIRPHYENERYISSVEDRVLNNGFAIVRWHREPA